MVSKRYVYSLCVLFSCFPLAAQDITAVSSPYYQLEGIALSEKAGSATLTVRPPLAEVSVAVEFPASARSMTNVYLVGNDRALAVGVIDDGANEFSVVDLRKHLLLDQFLGGTYAMAAGGSGYLALVSGQNQGSLRQPTVFVYDLASASVTGVGAGETPTHSLMRVALPASLAWCPAGPGLAVLSNATDGAQLQLADFSGGIRSPRIVEDAIRNADGQLQADLEAALKKGLAAMRFSESCSELVLSFSSSLTHTPPPVRISLSSH